MALAMAFDEAKTNQVSRKRDGNNTPELVITPFFGGRDKPDLPHAALSEFAPGRFSRPHFHMRDQFQVVVGGKGTLGRHELTPYVVHFTRAYTPYGPLKSGAGTGMTFFVMRAHADPGAQRVLDKLQQVPNRQPWQITRSVTVPTLQSDSAAADMILQADPDIKDEQGLAAYTLSMKPNATANAPDPSHGDGQYLAVVKGSLLYQNKEYKAFALVFVYPKEGSFQIHAGSEGLEALILNFPRPQTRATGVATNVRASTGVKTWQCTLCSFVYDEAAGMPEEGIPPGTRWQDVPDSWSCPDCGASKIDFQTSGL